MIYFRFHKGGFEESLNTQKKFKNINDLFQYLGSNNYIIRYYSYDDRKKIGDTFIVIDDESYHPIGFMYLKNGGIRK